MVFKKCRPVGPPYVRCSNVMEVLGKRLTVNEHWAVTHCRQQTYQVRKQSTVTALSRDETMLAAGCCRRQRPSTGRPTFRECAPNLGRSRS